jgi:hypothetical protein
MDDVATLKKPACPDKVGLPASALSAIQLDTIRLNVDAPSKCHGRTTFLEARN